jgi:hypothetical protein
MDPVMRKMATVIPEQDGTRIEAPDRVPLKMKKLRPLIIALVSITLFLSVSGFFLSLPSALTGHVDFRTFYTVGYMVRTGHASDIYNVARYQRYQNDLVSPLEGLLPFNHLAYEGLLYVPFSIFSYRVAYILFTCVNLFVFALSVKLFAPLLGALSEIWSHLALGLMISFLPVAMALIEGQDSLFLLFLFVAATVAFHEQKDFKAGVLFGLSLFKFQYAAPVAVLLVIWKRWQFLRGFLISAAVVISVSIWLTGFSGALMFVKSVLEVSARYSASNGVLYGIHPDGMPNFRGLSYMITGGSVWASHLITIGLSAVSMIWAAFRRPWIPGALLTALLVSYHQVIADSTLLLIPIALVLCRELKDLKTMRSRLVAFLSCIILVGPSILLFANTRFYLLALPVTALLLLWDLPSPNPSCGLLGRPQSETTLTHADRVFSPSV